MSVIAGNRRMEWAKWDLVLNVFTSLRECYSVPVGVMLAAD